MGNSTNKPLQTSTFDNTPTYSLKGIRTNCNVLRVYDGDTVWIALPIHGKIYKYRCRMYGYDSPEMKPSLKHPDREGEIHAANEAKLYLESLLSNQHVEAEMMEYDKYGRPLVRLYIKSPSLPSCLCRCVHTNTFIDVNKTMIDNGYGYPYTGGKKQRQTYEEELV